MAPSSSAPSKEAVVFLLDSNPTMNTPYPAGSNDTKITRLSCAKQALQDMISQLMIQSKQNEVAVIVLKTEQTSHHVISVDSDDDDDEDSSSGEDAFPNLTELPEGGVRRPTVELLRQVGAVESAASLDAAASLRGDFCDGIILAADALYRRTHGKRYSRRLVLFTDAAHEIKTDWEQVMQKIISLRALDCTLTVIGLDFEQSAEFEQKADESEAVKKEKDRDEDDDETTDGGESDTQGEKMDEEEPVPDEDGSGGDYAATVKRQNEELIVSMARLTGGSVVAASTMQKIAEATLGKRIVKSVRRKMTFQIAPGLALDARFSLLLKKENLPSMKKCSILLDEQLKPTRDGADEIMHGRVTVTTDLFDPNDENVNLPDEDVTSAFMYGSDYIPMGFTDMLGLRERSDIGMKIVGFTDRTNVPRSILIGPPYGVCGHDSQHACGAIAALAEALYRQRKVAICIFIKMKGADPILGALSPLEEEDSIRPSRLMFAQLPFADEVQSFSMKPLDNHLDEDKKTLGIGDSLIDSLMLPQDAIRSECIANPGIRSFRRTIRDRSLNPSSSKIVSVRGNDSEDPMSTPSDVLKRSLAHLKAFREAFPLEKAETSKDEKKKTKYWLDHEDIEI